MRRWTEQGNNTVSWTIWHNPRCSKSRQTLQLLEEHGITPTVRLYLNDPPSIAELQEALTALSLDARSLMRSKEAVFKELNLKNPTLTEADLLEVMVQHPKLIERPIVFAGHAAVLGRPPENIGTLIKAD